MRLNAVVTGTRRSFQVRLLGRFRNLGRTRVRVADPPSPPQGRLPATTGDVELPGTHRNPRSPEKGAIARASRRRRRPHTSTDVCTPAVTCGFCSWTSADVRQEGPAKPCTGVRFPPPPRAKHQVRAMIQALTWCSNVLSSRAIARHRAGIARRTSARQWSAAVVHGRRGTAADAARGGGSGLSDLCLGGGADSDHAFRGASDTHSGRAVWDSQLDAERRRSRLLWGVR
jgi:hypothetical protein